MKTEKRDAPGRAWREIDLTKSEFGKEECGVYSIDIKKAPHPKMQSQYYAIGNISILREKGK